MEMSSEGGGVRSRRRAMGKARMRSVLVLKSMRLRPATKRVREIMWYSRG